MSLGGLSFKRNTGDDITQVRIGGHSVGITGLKTVFAEVKALNITDPTTLQDEICQRVGKMNYIPFGAEEEYGKALLMEYRRLLGEQVEEDSQGLTIKILGPGCWQCDELEKRVMTAVAELNLPADVLHIRDLKEIAKYGVVPVPAIIVNGKVKSAGKVLSVAEIKKILL
jgi:small redox-active disulfide protein 2